MGGKTEIITVDRLKLAHLDVDSPVQLAQPRPRGDLQASHIPVPTPLAPQPSTSRLPQRARTGRQICPKCSPAAMPPAPLPSPQCTRSGRQIRPSRRYISVLGVLCSGLIIEPYVLWSCRPFPYICLVVH